MNVKIFQAFGSDGIQKLEREINHWLDNHAEPIEVVDTDITATDVADSSQGERQTLIVCVWYERLD
jgi:hypothetical protein